MYGTLPEKWNTEKLLFNECPSRKKSRLKKHKRRNALKISGDLEIPLSPIFLKVLFLWYRGRSDWIIPVTQKKVISPAMNMNISHWPISALVRWLFVNTMLIIRKTTGFISWKSWSPEILSINFSLFKTERVVLRKCLECLEYLEYLEYLKLV
jgi:hypothetical protein